MEDGRIFIKISATPSSIKIFRKNLILAESIRLDSTFKGGREPSAYSFWFFSENSRMDVFLMVRRKKTTIFLDAKETTTVLDLKKMIEGITKKSPSDQQIYNKDDVGRLYILVLSNAKRKEVS